MNTYLKKNAKKTRARRQFLLILAAFFAAVCLFLALGGRMRSGQVQASSNQEVCYTSIRVDAGDTLWDIADTYMGTAYDDREDYIDEVKAINHITEDALQAGSYIIVPSVMTVDQGNSLYR